MTVTNYEIIAPRRDREMPYINENGLLVVPKAKKLYRFYLEAKLFSPESGDYSFYLLLGTEKFDERCRKCRVDDYNRLMLTPHGELKSYVFREINARGNVSVTFSETKADCFAKTEYDVYKVE